MKTMRLWLLVTALPLFAQDWTPKRIVAITEYASLARMARIAGEVEIKCVLDAEGSVARADAVSGHQLLKEQARQNALLWKFQRASTQVSKNTVTLKYLYRLEGPMQTRGHTVFVVDLPGAIEITAPVAELNY